MAVPITIRMTLTGPFAGKTKLLNRHQFIDGIAHFTGNAVQVENVAKYFTRSYQVEVEEVGAEELEAVVTDHAMSDEEVEEAYDNEAIKEDDSDVLGDEEVEEEEDDGVKQPNARQAEIIAAVNCIDKEKWVDLQAGVPHPRVKDVVTLTEDPTITKKEIIEVVETWLS